MTLLQAGLTDSTGLVAFAGLVFAGYVAMLLYLGYDGYKKSDSVRDYILGSGKMNGFIVGLSFGATYASANMFMGVPGMAYTHGTPALWWSTIGFGMPFIALALFAKRFWLMSKLGVGDMTLPEWMAKRYNSPYIRLAAGGLSMFLVFYIAGQLVGAATMFETLFDAPYLLGLFAAGGLVAFYVGIGGMRTTILTDFVQAVLMMGFAVITFASLFWVFDGGILGVVDGLAEQGAATTFNTDTSNFIFDSPFGVLVMSWFLLAFILMPHLMNRILVLEDKVELRKFIFGAGVSLFTMSVFMVWAGLAGRVLFPDINPDSVVPMYLSEALHPVLAIFIIVGILSAILTTADSLLHSMVSIIQQDVYKESYLRHIKGADDSVINSKRVDRTATWVGRVSAVGIAGAAVFVGVERPDSLFMLTQIGIAGFLSGCTIPVIAGYFWKRTTKRGAEASFTVGFITYSLLFFDVGNSGIAPENQFLAFGIATVTSLITIVLVSAVTTGSVHEQQTLAFDTQQSDD